VLAHDRPEHEVLRTGLGRHGEALFATDQCVMLDLALVREERLTRFEADVVLTPFAVGQAYPFAFGQWARTHARVHRLAGFARHAFTKARSTSLLVSTPYTLPSGSVSTYSAAGVRCIARTSSSPDRSAESAMPVSIRLAT